MNEHSRRTAIKLSPTVPGGGVQIVATSHVHVLLLRCCIVNELRIRIQLHFSIHHYGINVYTIFYNAVSNLLLHKITDTLRHKKTTEIFVS